MKETKNVPQLRFSGFDDDWEEKKFGELYKKNSEKNDLSYGVDKIISVANMYYKADSIITDKNYLLTYNVFKKGDIAFEGNKSKDFANGRFVENSIGDGIVSHVFEVFRPIDNYDLFYWKYAINNEFLMRSILCKCTKKTTMMTNLVPVDFLQQKIKFPSLSEQQKIGSFLSHVDSIIQAKTKKLESLKAVKKSLLQKCFPKAGEKVPEMRFESNQEWASISFEDCFSFLSNNSFSRDELNYEKGYVKNLHYGDVLIKFGEILSVSTESLPYITRINSPKEYSKSILKNGDIVIADAAEDNTVGKCTEIQNCTELLAAGLHTIAVRPKIEFAPTFLGFCINSESFHNQLLPLIQGTKVSSISKSAIVDTVIYYPISITEQQKIGQFFSKYNSLISVQQKEIDKLKDIKKSLLQKMFI